MPFQGCSVSGKRGTRWGKIGKCYTGVSGKAKAAKQTRAILASGWTGNASDCGAGAEGSPGFQPGNTCGAGEVSASHDQVITGYKEAAEVVADQVLSGKFASESMREMMRSEPMLKAEIVKNWMKVFRSKNNHVGGKTAFQDIPKEFHALVNAGIQDNKTAPEFQKYVQKYGSMPVVVRNLEKGNFANGEYRGGTTHVYYHETFAKGEKATGPLVVGAGTISTESGIAGMLRHEYAHGIYEAMGRDKQSAWDSMTRAADKEEVHNGISLYASGVGATRHASEAFAETFAMATHKDFSQENASSVAKQFVAKMHEVLQ